MIDDTQNEFHNLKLQFEEFGNAIYERVNAEVNERITVELAKSLTVLHDSLAIDFHSQLSQQVKPLEMRLLQIESQTNQQMQAQEMTLEEFNKYQDTLEGIIDKNAKELKTNMQKLEKDITK